MDKLADCIEQKSEHVEAGLVSIQKILYPNLMICDVESMYFRLDDNSSFDYSLKSIILSKGALASFDTYFNGFYLDKWKTHTNVSNIGAYLNLRGSFRVSVFNVDTFGEHKSLISQRIVSSESLAPVQVLRDLNLADYSGMIYIQLESLQGRGQVSGGEFYSCSKQNIAVKLAVVMCTYRRESYVNKNISLLKDLLFNQESWKTRLEVFVIDNGKSLGDFDSEFVHVIPNKNAGGSGGFARGMIEVLKKQQEFSHVILMDDDITFDPSIIERLWNFLSLSSSENFCVGGSMLRSDKNYIQHEGGANCNIQNGCVPLNSNVDLRELSNTLLNQVDNYIGYGAWWFFCLPVSSIEQYGLPYPFFVKFDDIEFSMRIRSHYKILILNGVCVWHEIFENKHNSIAEYYSKRNSLLFNSIHQGKNFSRVAAIKGFLKPVLRELLLYRYETALIILTAVSDYLQGYRRFVNVDPELNHRKISAFTTEKTIRDSSLKFSYSKYLDSESQTENTFKKVLRYLTLNGHLLPSFLLKNLLEDDEIGSDGYRVVPYLAARPLNVFRARKVLYYRLNTQEGFVVKFSRIRFFKTLAKALWLSASMFFSFSKLKDDYADSFSELTSQEFWEKYLEIDN